MLFNQQLFHLQYLFFKILLIPEIVIISSQILLMYVSFAYVIKAWILFCSFLNIKNQLSLICLFLRLVSILWR